MYSSIHPDTPPISGKKIAKKKKTKQQNQTAHMHTHCNPEKSRVFVVIRVSAQQQTRMDACTRLLNVVERLKTGKKKKNSKHEQEGGDV